MRRHHDLPLEFERHFVRAGIDPDTVGRWLSKEMHRGFHYGKGYGHGGAFNYQWEAFLLGVDQNKRLDVSNPRESILDFLMELRTLTANGLPDENAWPIAKGLLP